MDDLLELLRKNVGIQSNAEISLELDPGTFDGRKLHDLVRVGVTRFSVGIQTLNEAEFDGLGRPNTLDEAFTALKTIRRADLGDAFSADLMIGLPN